MDNKMIVFISGKYRGKTKDDVETNIRVAREASMQLWKRGYVVICPHLNTAHFGDVYEDDVWLNGYLEILRRCDIIYMLKGWDYSEGAKRELQLANELGLTVVFQSEDSLCPTVN